MNVDKTLNPRNRASALLIQGIYIIEHYRSSKNFDVLFGLQFLTKGSIFVLDDGGGMTPEAMRRCLSFGFSNKKSMSAIGQCMILVLLYINILVKA